MTNQRDVGTWHRRTFPSCSAARLRAKFREETREADEAFGDVGFTDDHHLRDELADVAIVLMAIADRCGFDLQSAIDAKFDKVVAKYRSDTEPKSLQLDR